MTLNPFLESCRTALTTPGGLRQAALARALARGLPDKEVEDWKYSAPTLLAGKQFVMDGTAQLDVAPWQLPHFDGLLLVLINGRYRPDLSGASKLPVGLQIETGAALIPPDQGSSFTELNTALGHGLQLQVADGAVIGLPVHVLYLHTGAGVMSHPRLRVHLGRNGQLQLIEHYAGADEEYLCNAVTEIELDAGARLDHHRLQEHGSAGLHVGSLHIRQARDSCFTSHSTDLGGAWVRNDVFAELCEPGTEATLNGVYAPLGAQHMDNHTRVDHRAAQGTSRESFRGILDGRSRGIFNGKVIVHPGAQKTDSEQSSAALLLSRTAEVDAKPELEIYADDVKCRHGATVGQLDEDAVFYLQSRGLSAEAARSLLTYSFADELIGRIELEPLRRRIEQSLLARLPGAAQFEGLLQ